MSLPILQFKSEPSPRDLLRLYEKARHQWVGALAEEENLQCATALVNPSLPRVHDANHVRDVALPAGMRPAEAFEIVEHYFAQKSVRCWKWIMNPSAPADQTLPMADHLLANGYTPESADVLALRHVTQSAIPETPALKIIPARASFRHARILAEERSGDWNEPQLADAFMLHLDEPHYDALLAIDGTVPVATVGVLSVGDIGLIEPLYVSDKYRHHGIGQAMMGRALEICARSLFKRVLLAVAPGNTTAIALYTSLGFEKIGASIDYTLVT